MTSIFLLSGLVINSALAVGMLPDDVADTEYPYSDQSIMDVEIDPADTLTKTEYFVDPNDAQNFPWSDSEQIPNNLVWIPDAPGHLRYDSTINNPRSGELLEAGIDMSLNQIAGGLCCLLPSVLFLYGASRPGIFNQVRNRNYNISIIELQIIAEEMHPLLRKLIREIKGHDGWESDKDFGTLKLFCYNSYKLFLEIDRIYRQIPMLEKYRQTRTSIYDLVGTDPTVPHLSGIDIPEEIYKLGIDRINQFNRIAQMALDILRKLDGNLPKDFTEINSFNKEFVALQEGESATMNETLAKIN